MALKKFEKSSVSREVRPWVREVESRIQNLERDSERNNNAGDNANKGQNSTMAQLSEQIRALPIPVGQYQIETGFGLSTTVFVQTTIYVPPGKTKMTLTAIGNVAALDMTSGGAAVAQATIEVNGSDFLWSSPVIPASKDAGASVVNNIITPALGFQQGGLVPGNSFFVALSIFATNGTAFPANSQNYGTLTVNCIFFD